MEPVANLEARESSEPQLGEKRHAKNGGGDDEFVEKASSKKARFSAGAGRDLKRVAEIVLVLSTMANMRGGKKPTDVEVELMAEARDKLVEMCEGLAPKEIVGRDGIGAVIEDLGLNGKVKDQRLGFRGPMLTIAEKLSLSKRKMEESKKFVAPPPAAYNPHPLHPNSSAVSENRSPAAPLARMFTSSEKLGHLQGLSLPQDPISSATTSTSVQLHLPASEVRAPHVASGGFTVNHYGRESTSAFPKAERAPNGIYPPQMLGNSSANHPLVNAPAWSIQNQSSSLGKTSVNAQGTIDTSIPRVTPQAATDQSFTPGITQTVTGIIPGSHQPLQNMSFAQAPSLPPGNHIEIARVVQKLLQPQLPDHPTWTPPSRDYMNKAVTCQSCQFTVNEVDTVLICDACEKGFHLKCVQSPNQRAIPRGEWHCSRCLALSNGKPLPPKYGRVMRSNPPLKVPSNPTGVQLSSEKKVETMESKASQQQTTPNGGSDLQSPFQTRTGSFGSNYAASVLDSETSNVKQMHGNSLSAKHENVDYASLSTQTKSLPSPASGYTCVGLSNDRSAQEITNSELPTKKGNLPELNPEASSKSVDMINSKPDMLSQPGGPQIVDRPGLPNISESPSEKCNDSDLTVQDAEKAHLEGCSYRAVGHEIKQADREVAQMNVDKGLDEKPRCSDRTLEREHDIKQDGQEVTQISVYQGLEEKSDQEGYPDRNLRHDNKQDGQEMSQLNVDQSLQEKLCQEVCPDKALGHDLKKDDQEISQMNVDQSLEERPHLEGSSDRTMEYDINQDDQEITEVNVDQNLEEKLHLEGCSDRKLGHENKQDDQELTQKNVNQSIEEKSHLEAYSNRDLEHDNNQDDQEDANVYLSVVKKSHPEGSSDRALGPDNKQDDQELTQLNVDQSLEEKPHQEGRSDRTLGHDNKQDDQEMSQLNVDWSLEENLCQEDYPDRTLGHDLKKDDQEMSHMNAYQSAEERPHLEGSPDRTMEHDIKQDDQEITQMNVDQSLEDNSQEGCSDRNVEHDVKQDDREIVDVDVDQSLETSSSDGLHDVEWVGRVIQVDEGKSFYQSCCVDGVTYRLQDHALFYSNHGKLTPSKLQSMWEDSGTGAKWVSIIRYYFPSDLLEYFGCPSLPDCNEVYESNQNSTVMAGFIRGLCEVFPTGKFKEECGRRDQLLPDASNGLPPIFLCNWFYDESKGQFEQLSS